MVLGIENILDNDSELANFELDFNQQYNWSWICTYRSLSIKCNVHVQAFLCFLALKIANAICLLQFLFPHDNKQLLYRIR